MSNYVGLIIIAQSREDLDKIGEGAFLGSGIKEFEIPKTVKKLGSALFEIKSPDLWFLFEFLSSWFYIMSERQNVEPWNF